MTHLPDLRDELIAAAARTSPSVPRRGGTRPQRRTLALSVAFTLGLAGTAGAFFVAAGVVGSRPTAPVPAVPAEEASGMTRTRTPRIVATGELPRSGRVELVGYTMRGYSGRGELLCLDVVLQDASRHGGCDRSIPGRAAGLIGTGNARSPGPVLAVGATRQKIASIDVTFTTGGRRHRQSALLLEVSQEQARRLALAAGSFVYYISELPPRATRAVAVARSSDGEQLWRTRFGG